MCAQRRLRSAWDAQADLSLRWAHSSFCWFYHAVAQILVESETHTLVEYSLF